MSLNLRAIVGDATHRNRAINTLTGLSLIFMRCALVLMGGQNHRAIGAELFVVCGLSAVVFVKGYVRALRMSDGLRFSRIAGGSLVHVAEMTGAALFFFGFLAGLYIAAIAIVANTCYMITAAWLLVVAAVDRPSLSRPRERGVRHQQPVPEVDRLQLGLRQIADDDVATHRWPGPPPAQRRPRHHRRVGQRQPRTVGPTAGSR